MRRREHKGRKTGGLVIKHTSKQAASQDGQGDTAAVVVVACQDLGPAQRLVLANVMSRRAVGPHLQTARQALLPLGSQLTRERIQQVHIRPLGQSNPQTRP